MFSFFRPRAFSLVLCTPLRAQAQQPSDPDKVLDALLVGFGFTGKSQEAFEKRLGRKVNQPLADPGRDLRRSISIRGQRISND